MKIFVNIIEYLVNSFVDKNIWDKIPETGSYNEMYFIMYISCRM